MPARDIDLQWVYENLPIALCVIGRDGCLMAANKVHANLAGMPAETLIGLRVADLHEEGGRNVERDFQFFDRGQSVPNHELEIRGRHYLVSTSPVYDDEGRVHAISVAHFDISEKKAAEQKSEKLTRQLKGLATLDHLTGAYNRRHFDRLLKAQCGTLRRSGEAFSLIIFDIDHFKSYNDVYGHQAGDICLRAVAVATRRVLRKVGTDFCRYGGEEFAVLIRDPDLKIGAKVAERICASVRRLAAPHQSGVNGIVTVSCGVAHTAQLGNANAAEIEGAILRAADTALYDAKRAGRNQVCCFAVLPGAFMVA